MKIKAIMVFFFTTTTPFRIALGIGLSNVYKDNSLTALIVVGLLNVCSAGLLNYMALVDLLAADFMGPKLQGNIRLQIWAYLAVLLGGSGMSVMAIWVW
ncbi:Fe(2+) transport protein 1 [Acorus gramineus]|uniref:Fe(2+) transport protein 1 n=1 Tax=Acorus gramineus TaxID=55184 RepID=A0AAV9BVY2_ACOGR|nr:Fe(2+) transport protein 1 [Acorus gramineus]